jgi:hypothetical protein
MSYNLYKHYKKRHHTPAIIISHLRNFHNKNLVLEPRLKLGSSTYTWPKIKEHFYRHTVTRDLPFHYFLEQVGDDFDVQVGLPEYAPSLYLYELAAYGLLPDYYKDSIIICIAEDLSFEKAEGRMYEQLCAKLLVPIQERYKKTIQRDKIIYIDEIFNKITYDLLLEGRALAYDYKPAIYFNEVILNTYYKKHHSNISLT